MAYYIGIDLGTSALKLLLVDESGTIHNTVTREYPLEFPTPAGASRPRRIGSGRCWRECPSCSGALTPGR